ncbi:hypothetical protein G5I_07720 [Acromyrmex echinatior]|uniref:Uncharacterized protein n=1 Tax=Acromyrmex echinatior TaxID=103372 RepID=F4WPK2_ACREC|nr:hypothetical protein G5I_07720 [Acromyrmex echinatior]
MKTSELNENEQDSDRESVVALIVCFQAPENCLLAKNSALTVATQNQTAVWRNGSHSFKHESMSVLACGAPRANETTSSFSH